MVQLIIVYIIIGIALAYTVYSLIKTLGIKSSGSCSDECSCSAKSDIHKALKNAKAKQLQINSIP